MVFALSNSAVSGTFYGRKDHGERHCERGEWPTDVLCTCQVWNPLSSSKWSYQVGNRYYFLSHPLQLGMSHISDPCFQKANWDPKHNCSPHTPSPQQSHSTLFSYVLNLYTAVARAKQSRRNWNHEKTYSKEAISTLSHRQLNKDIQSLNLFLQNKK